MTTGRQGSTISCGNDMQGWDGDNSGYVVGMLPLLKLSEKDKYIIRWAYGKEVPYKSWEQESDGETLVKDWYLNGSMKNPAGVVHDALNRAYKHRTPDGHVWTWWEANAIYFRIQVALGSGYRLAVRRWFGLTISVFSWWRKPEVSDDGNK